MEIKNKGKNNQVVWGIWEDAYKGFIPRELKIIETDSRLGNGDKVYHLICKTNKVNVYTTGSKLFSTQAEAQAECNRRNSENKTKKFLKANKTLSELKKIKRITSNNADKIKNLASHLLVDIVANDFVEGK